MLQNIFVTMMASSIEFNPMAFVDNLYYMGMGMLGIFGVTGVIILIVSLLNKSGSKPKKDKEDK